MMNFNDPSNNVKLNVEGGDFPFNIERLTYIANDQIYNYTSRIEHHHNRLKKKKKKEHATNSIISIYQEWNVEDNDEILYLLFSESDEDLFTDLILMKDLYPNHSEEELCE